MTPFARHPGQNSPAHMLVCPNRDKTRPAGMPACPNRDKTRPAHTLAYSNRYKTRPAGTLFCPNRYKTHPAPQKMPILGRFRPAGRKLSRFLRRHSKQGDLCRATSGGFAHGALHLHRNHMLGPRKARAGTHTAFMSTMSHGDWDALKEISPLLGIVPADMKH